MMRTKSTVANRKRFIETIKAKQRNTVWPDPLINSRGVDAFLWKGSPDAPLVQRIGAWIFGLTFVLLGVVFVVIARNERSWIGIVVSIAPFLIGGRVFLNGFRKRKAKASSIK
jgi:hypothetical protein